MLQRYICALADPICNPIDYTTRVAILGAVARDGLNTPVPSDYAKEGKHAFLAPLPGTQNLVATLRNANKHFWRHCWGWHVNKDIVLMLI